MNFCHEPTSIQKIGLWSIKLGFITGDNQQSLFLFGLSSKASPETDKSIT
jgi:hypothetical protein